MSPMNLAGVLPWTDWRGLTVVGAAGGGQRLLHGLPVHAPARGRAPAVDAHPPAPAVDAVEVARRGPAGASSSGPTEAFGLWDAPRATAWLIARLLRRRAGRRQPLARRELLQVRLPDRAVPVRRLARLAARGRSARARGLRDLHDARLHPRQRDPARLRAGAVPAAQGRQPRLHVLPRLRARVPARQHRAARHVARRARWSSTDAARRSDAWRSVSTWRRSRSSWCWRRS